MSFKKHYSLTLVKNPGRLHFAAHSHHMWPDVTRAAQTQYWDDSAEFLDDKWDKVFGSVIPQAQRHVAQHIGVSRPEQIQFFSNTHDFIVRLLTCFDLNKKFRVLTTDSEFYSFERQMLRLEELSSFEVVRVPTEPFATFKDRFLEHVQSNSFDLVFFSQVFFNSGWCVELDEDWIQALKRTHSQTVIDGYHSFFAVPVSLEHLQDKVFFISGGYKYAQGGEGVCFAYVPPNFQGRPWNTGWMADYGSLSTGLKKPVSYAGDASRMAGATFDPSGIYRFNAVCELWNKLGLGVADIHHYVRGLQNKFYQKLTANSGFFSPKDWILNPEKDPVGHFLTWRNIDAPKLHGLLKKTLVMTDLRKTSLRVGFGLYHDLEDVDLFVERVTQALDAASNKT
jgi:kynureninase